MVRFSKEIFARYKKFDYNGVIKNFDWITAAIKELFANIMEPEVEIAFKMGDIHCSCNSIDEFKEHAYGQNISVYTYNLLFFQNIKGTKKSIVYIILSDIQEKQIRVHCDDKKTLITICTKLEDTLYSEKEKEHVFLQQTLTHIDQSTNISIGDNSTIKDSNIGKINQLSKEENLQKKPFWKRIWQSIMANWMQILLKLGLIGLLAYFGYTNTDWMNLF